MNYLPQLFFLVSLSIVSIIAFALLHILDIFKVNSKQKIIFIRVSLLMIMLALFVFILSKLYSPHILEITLPAQFMNQNIPRNPSVVLFKHQILWPFYIYFLYVVGLCIMLSRIAFSYLSAKKQLRSSNSIIIQSQQVFLNKNIQTPLSFGFPKAKIYLPQDPETKWTPREIQMILAHENVHIAQNDSLWKLLSLVVKALLFFTPWASRFHRRFELEMEIFCDLKTCKKTGVDIKEYGNFLLTMTCTQPQNLIFTNITDSTLKRRLLAMKSKTVNSGLLVFIFSLVLLLTGSTAIGMTSGINKKDFFRITTKIIIDGKLVSSPQILAKENQRAEIVIANNTETEKLRMQLVAKNLAKNDAIEIDFDIEYKNKQGEMHSNPQMMVFPNQEAKITLSSDLNHTYEMLVVAARE